MKKSIYLSIFLATISIISALILSLTNSLTAETIKNVNIAKQNRKLQLMFNENTKFLEENRVFNEKIIEKIFKAEENGEVKGYIYSLQTKGYGGKIRFLIAVDQEGKYLGFDSLEHNETPGFGTKMDEEKYKGQFKVKSVNDEIDGITGATVTSKGLVSGIEAAKEDFESNYRK
ncbi:MAG: RnfABCDGE type electron transport complex subunit G [Leptotrichiaceae bacterium]|nr:RnfABCDGE type electron transport complex subunit G [Leptotrichiaceae bacterium]MBP6281659.1 RnfABCDGE type electron transport complex subunit G [Leptotrichiaceae bacterium]MBP7100027.1 RnfABCDGE type electron transport complex subunit G [Leptotrichiaceae bacterium]MBP7725374.1 RnfABCDGE type electron transport complex subunit G [Leptotrichiaceae bacterium]MBP9628950.1 RnfABCDGE type electron transport complex subunit G [Leptotrichiaceae bacterium]